MNHPIRFRHESASAKLTMLDHPNAYLLTNVWSGDRGKGHARGLMETVVRFAETNQLSVTLEARPYGHPIQTALNTKQLVEFYEKFGFAKYKTLHQPTGILMIRWPSQVLHGM